MSNNSTIPNLPLAISLLPQAQFEIVQNGRSMRAAVSQIGGTSGQAGAIVTATETIFAGAFVNFYSNGGQNAVQLADATNVAKRASGFAPSAIPAGQQGTILFSGLNASVTPSSPAPQTWLSETSPGGYQTSAPVGAGHIVQTLGPAVVGYGVFFTEGIPIQL